MLRITVSKSAGGAKKYYTESYYNEGKEKRHDYYAGMDDFIGKWGGKAAEKLGLGEDIRKSDFDALCDNKRPDNGKVLTGRTTSNRRVGYDFTFNASKSISLAHALASKEDKESIEAAFSSSVATTMKEIELNMQARVRDGGKDENRKTGNLVYGEFVHYTTRPIDGVPDPHLHTHCFVFNATHDAKSKQWKAGQFGQIKKDAPYYQAYFHSELAKNLQETGYEVERTKNGIELKGVAQETIDRFSRRTQEIEQHAVGKGITDIEAKAHIGSRTRESKRTEVSREKQYEHWVDRLSKSELSDLRALHQSGEPVLADSTKTADRAKEALQYALDHHLERKSVASDKEILAIALKSSLGDTHPALVQKALNERKDVLKVKQGDQTLLTTRAAIDEERLLIRNAVACRGIMPPINKDYQPKGENLNKQQKEAIKQTLSTYDSLSIITGKAGTGKTTLMKEIKVGILSAGKQINAYAPSADASRGVQRAEGFQNANTVASLIQNKDKQHNLKDQVIWIDEAGLLSNKQMNHILHIAKQQNARVILSGDTKQHNSVERGDALRVLQEHAKIKSVTVSKIYRQQNKDYKEAVSHLSKGDVDKGFQKLDRMGVVHQIDNHQDRAKQIAKDYYQSSYRNNKPHRNVLVVSPTHKEGDIVTQAIRDKLKQESVVHAKDREYSVFKNLQFTQAEKENIDSYSKGLYLSFHQNMKGVIAGSHLQIVNKAEHYLTATNKEGKELQIPLNMATRYHVYEEAKINIAKGDKIRITNNSKDIEGKRLNNGNNYFISGFTREGGIKLSNGSVIDKDFKHFKHGYVSTSHSAQGKTVDKVIIAQSTMSARAASKEQFYVSASRGRQAVAIYTDNKIELLKAVKQSNQRMTGTELYAKAPLVSKANFNGRLMIQKAKDNSAKMLQQTRNAINRRNERIQRAQPPPAPRRGR